MVLITCSGFVNTSKTSWIGASNSRVRTISRSFGNSMCDDPCRLGVTAALLAVAQVLGNLGLGYRRGAHDLPDRLLAGHQHVQDFATVRLGNRVEDVRRRGRAGHAPIIFLY